MYDVVLCAYDMCISYCNESHGYLVSIPASQIGRRMYHKRVAEYEEASSTLTSSAPVVEGSPMKKMRIMPSAPSTSVMVKQVEQIRMSTMMPQQQKVEQFAAPSVSLVQQPIMIAPTTPPQSSWKSIAIDELAMQQSNALLPFKTFSSSNTTTLDNSRRVSLAASDDGSMYCVTAPMKFPETINLRPSDINAVSSSANTPVGIVSPISQIDMDFDTLDTAFDLNNNDFDKLFDLDQDSKSSSGNVDDDSASVSCSSITDDDMSMECDAFELPFSPVTNKMEEAQPDQVGSEEPSVDDFLKLIAQLDDNLPSYPMALAA